MFRASIGNLPPGKEVLVRITYVTELPVDDGRLRFTLPTTIAPKYAPAEDQRGVGRPEAEAVNPPVAWQVPYGLHLSLRVRDARRAHRPFVTLSSRRALLRGRRMPSSRSRCRRRRSTGTSS